MAKPEVRVIKEYTGQFRGWQEECVNCEADSPRYSRNLNNIKPLSPAQRKAYRAGYCECNCQQEEKHLKF